VGSYRNTKKERRVEKRMKCKRSFVLMALVLTLMLVSVAMVQATKPLRFEVDPGWKEPNGVGPDPNGWGATIKGGPFDGYTMYWDQPIIEQKGSRVYFFENWWIEDGDGDEILRGYDEGVTRMKNGKFTGNGKVTDAISEYTHLIGLKEQCEGTVIFVDASDPTTWTFTGTIQIN
jgi:hypothetical protein